MATAKPMPAKEAQNEKIGKALYSMFTNRDAKRYEFLPRKSGTSYTVGFDEVDSEAEAWEALQNALNASEE